MKTAHKLAETNQVKDEKEEKEEIGEEKVKS